MHKAEQIGKWAAPILLCSLLFEHAGLGQMPAPGPGSRPRQVEIDLTIRQSSGEVLSVPASVKLFLNGMQCGEGQTSSGRISFNVSGLGRYAAVVEVTGYKTGQNSLSVSEPIRMGLEVTLEKISAGNAAAGQADTAILAPKAKEALDRAAQALRENDLKTAEKALERSVKLAPNHPSVLYVEGVLELRKHEWLKAETALEKVTQMEPSSARAFSGLGMARCNQKKYAEAIRPLEKSLELDAAAGWETQWALGESYYQNARFEDALRISQKAESELDGQAPQLDLLLARALTAVGRYEDSAKVLRELVKNHSDGPEAAVAQRFLERLATDGKIKEK